MVKTRKGELKKEDKKRAEELENDILFDIYMDACLNLDRITELLVQRGWTHAELAVYYKEHRGAALDFCSYNL